MNYVLTILAVSINDFLIKLRLYIEIYFIVYFIVHFHLQIGNFLCCLWKMCVRCMKLKWIVCLLMSKFSHFGVRKFYFKRSFNNISGNCGPLFSQMNFDQTYFGGVCPAGFCLGVYVLDLTRWSQAKVSVDHCLLKTIRLAVHRSLSL